MHALLKRQLKRHFGDLEALSPEWQAFLQAVNDAYKQFDVDRLMLERSLELTSQELLQANAEMRLANDELRIQKQLFENLVTVAWATTQNLNLEETLRDTLDVAIRLTATEARGRNSLILLNEAGEITSSALGRNDLIFKQPEEIVTAIIRDGLAGWVVQHHQTALLLDTAQDPRWLASPEDSYTARSALAVPLLDKAMLLGVLTLTHPNLGYFTPEHVNLMEAAASQMVLALRNARNYEELLQAKDAADSANQAKSEFVSVVSHELNNPLTAVRGYADLLAAGVVGPINDQQADFLKTINANAVRMQTLVSDLTDISRIESGRLRLECSPVSITRAVEEVLRSMQNQIEGRQQTLRIHMDADLPLVWADHNRLVQVLTNLISNAHKYTIPGGNIFLAVELEERANSANKMVQVTVQDTGIGIKPEDQNKLFQKFFRADDEWARQSPGTGLGLTITKNLIELQGGRIWFESRSGEGSTFYFTIPVAGQQS
ncbi:MAG: HAMP domain-containing histidine kinase [Chloroflexi bacterium]|nr:HAMP domain-containing histidine kinase [Chloroflexota bacterium]MCI0579257.1 HAMP domain-containing histidine kinase [Chloroflexota bacterium]MCI0649382.1 HAMP domain-containing histidine kinase [Chloroflexota bacterium]MCI0727019.1 HAMP domain-containing histidine kinase [Chloroflexota bacterium]